MAPASSGSKAFFTNIDTGSVFFVQFNPKEFKLDEKANWKASDEHENDVPLLTYEKGEPTVVTMDLVFDSTDDGSDVYAKYVEPLRDFLTADVQVTDGEGDKMKRPPFCQFTWASFTFHCVVEKLSATCLMFKPDGTALRAKVQVGLKERVRNVNGGGTDAVTLSAVGSMFTGAAGKANTYTIQYGDTLSSVAAKTKTNPRDIAIANDIQDPIDLPPGRKLVIPADSKLAEILAQQGKKRQDGNWAGPPTGPGPKIRGGYLGGAPSTFDEVVGLDYDVDPGGIAAQYQSFGKMDYSVRGDSQGSLGTAGQGIGQGTDKKSALAEFFRNDATPEEQGGGKTAQGYDVRGDSQSSLGTAGQGIGLGVDKDSEGTFGDAGKHFAGGDFGDSDAALHFRDEATPDEQGAAHTALGYDVRGDSQGTYGDAGKHFAGGNFGDSDAAGHFRNDATPDAQGAGPSAQHYGGYGSSDGTFGTAGQGGGSGGGLGAGSDRTFGTSGEGGGHAGFGSSDGTFGTSGQGAGQGGHASIQFGGGAGGGAGDSAGAGGGHLGNNLGAIRDGAIEGSGSGAGGSGSSGYGGYGGGSSESTFGTAGQGAGAGGSGGSLKNLMAAHGRVADHGAVGGDTVSAGGQGAEALNYGGHTGGLASTGGGGAEGGGHQSLKDLMAAHGRLDGQAEGTGGDGDGGRGVADALHAAGGHRAAVQGAADKSGADFQKAFDAAKAVADAKKQGE